VLSVLRGEPEAPAELRERALLLAGRLLELAGTAPAGSGEALARSILGTGAAWRKFEAICRAQGGLRTTPVAGFTSPVLAQRAGRVDGIDNRRLSRVAKLAGAPHDPAAGLVLHHPLGSAVEAGEPLFTVHAEAPGMLAMPSRVAATNRIVGVDPA
jgi:thymidine phosphorylase